MSQPFHNQIYFDLAGKRSPGKATVLGGGSGRPSKWDEQAGWGLSGAFLIYGGDGLASFSIRIDLWKPEHKGEWETFSEALNRPPKGKRPAALSIAHPLINAQPWAISSVVVLDVGLPEEDGKGLTSITIQFKVWRAPLARIGRIDGTVPDPGKAAPKEAKTAAEIEIAKLTAERERLAAL
jgi:hypothetical protein